MRASGGRVLMAVPGGAVEEAAVVAGLRVLAGGRAG
jgi:hypothetical protein